jgi:hypothetical protein
MIRDYINGKIKALSEQQIQKIGIGGFTMYAATNRTRQRTAQAPVSYLENGSFSSDDIINDPIRLTITGEVADIHIEGSSSLLSLVPPAVSETLGAVRGYIPDRAAGTISKITGIISSVNDRISQIDSAIAAGQRLFGLAGGATKSIQEQFLDHMESLYNARQPVSVEMDYRNYTNMAIVDFSDNKDNIEDALKFSITLQELRFNELQFTEITKAFPAPAPAVKSQAEGSADKVAQAPTKSKSFLSILTGG